MVFVFNSSILGGAERSLILQVKRIDTTEQYSFAIPFISEESEANKISEVLYEEFPDREINIIRFKYPKSLYSLSRESSPIKFLFIPFILLFFSFQISRKFKSYSFFWLNGNKVLIPFLIAQFFNNKQLIWHLRDYPAKEGIFRFIWPILKYKKPDLHCIANSHSVKESLLSINNSLRCDVIYNPSSNLVFQKKQRISVIGVVSMFSHWKGIHQVIEMVNLFEDQLRACGIREVCIYGDEVYQTNGLHQGIGDELKSLAKSNLIKFKGISSPQSIFSTIDLLIHSSVKPEPFGRVIIEAFKSGVPVLSTALGGSSELIKEDHTGLSFIKYDYADLFSKIKLLSSNMEKCHEIGTNAFYFSNEVDLQITKQMNLAYHELFKNESSRQS